MPWLYSCARNVVGNEYQRRARIGKLRRRMVTYQEAATIALPVERDLELSAAIRKLPVADRELIAMVYWYDVSVREAAEILGTSEASAKMRLSRLRRRLKTYLLSPRELGEVARNG